MNSWTNNMYHNEKGMVLGNVAEYNNQYKALLKNIFIGWYISEDFAKRAVEEAYRDTKGEIGYDR